MMTRHEIRSLTDESVRETRRRLHTALSGLIAEEPDHTLQVLLHRFDQSVGDDVAMHASLDLADFCAQREMQSVSMGQPSIRWAHAKRAADHLAACHMDMIEGRHTDAMTHALAALERLLWVQK